MLSVLIQVQLIEGILEAATIVKPNNFCTKSQKHKTVTIKNTLELDMVGIIKIRIKEDIIHHVRSHSLCVEHLKDGDHEEEGRCSI